MSQAETCGKRTCGFRRGRFFCDEMNERSFEVQGIDAPLARLDGLNKSNVVEDVLDSLKR